jgi:hypothetical protein
MRNQDDVDAQHEASGEFAAPHVSVHDSDHGEPAPVRVKIILSRPAYRIGGVVVGTILCYLDDLHGNTSGRSSQRQSGTTRRTLRNDILQFLQFQMVGKCRLDPRWYHEPMDYEGLDNGIVVTSDNDHLNPMGFLPLPALTREAKRGGVRRSIRHDKELYFWTTTPINLLELPERTSGSWRELRPKPIRLHYDDDSIDADANDDSALIHDVSDVDNNESELIFENGRQLAFTFRIDLPTINNQKQFPPSITTAACRYSYSILVGAATAGAVGASFNPKSKRTPLVDVHWTEAQVTLLTPEPLIIPSAIKALPHQPRVHVMAHSNGLPTYLTVSELHELPGKIVAHRNEAAAYRNLYYHNRSSMNTASIAPETMRVTDPQTGRPVCILTIIGRPLLSAGSRLLLRFEFPHVAAANTAFVFRDNHSDGAAYSQEPNWLPCYQICACLQGEELAVHRPTGGVVGSAPAPQTTRTKRHVFATAHERLDPECAECVSFQLLVPHDAPCSVSTNRLESTTICILDFAVPDATKQVPVPAAPMVTSEPRRSANEAHLSLATKTVPISFRNLRLELPCPIYHAVEAFEMPDDDDDDNKEKMEQLFRKATDADTKHSSNHFSFEGVQKDLQTLSMVMAEHCGLRPDVLRPLGGDDQ